MYLSVTFVFVVNERGPDYFKENIPFHRFASSIYYLTSATNLIRALVELCPNLNNWQSYVNISEDKVARHFKGALHDLRPADSLPSLEKLSLSLQISLRATLGLKSFPKGPTSQPSFTQIPVTPPSAEEETEQIQSPIQETPQDEDEALFLKESEEAREEIIDENERLLRDSISSQFRLVQKAIQEEQKEDRAKHKESLLETYNQLAQHHRNKRKRKQDRQMRKIQRMDQEKKKGETFQRNLELQRKGIEILTKLYDALSRLDGAKELIGIDSELCFLDRQIASLIDISFSAVVAGQINVGKSTVVNCFTGKELCPSRSSVMTAIPTNYVHDPQAEEPVMVIPFYSQLNEIMDRIRELVNQSSLESIQDMVDKSELRDLVTQIKEGLTFKSQYKGSEAIILHSTQIHDLFRLSVCDSLFDIVGDLLPLDWSEGLDSYLTVFLRFPSIDDSANLVNFSIIDTPGIDEDGVKKLQLRKMIQDTLGVAAYGALVTHELQVHSQGIADLKAFFKAIKDKYQTPLSAIVTRWENRSPNDQDKEKFSQALTPSDSSQRTFEPGHIYPVSAKKMFSAKKMKDLIDSLDGEKPPLEHPSPQVRRIFRRFLLGLRKDRRGRKGGRERERGTEKTVVFEPFPPSSSKSPDTASKSLLHERPDHPFDEHSHPKRNPNIDQENLRQGQGKA